IDPANETAKDCLKWAAMMSIDQDLNTADAERLSDDKDDKKDAIALASKWAHAGAPPERRKRAWDILNATRSPGLSDRYVAIVPSWLRDVLVTIAILIAAVLLLLVARRLWREWQRGKWYRDVVKTSWSMQPLKEIPVVDGRTGIATDALLDALCRVGHELGRKLWAPKLLLLRPTPPAEYEPAIITDFLSRSLKPLVLAPVAKDLKLEWQLHDIQLDQALQNLQIKTTGGID